MKNFSSILIVVLFLSSCISKKKEFVFTPTDGGRFYGGTFRYNEEEYFKSLFPLNITEVTGHRIAEQIYEGLVKFDDSTLAVIPCLAKSWDISADGLIYTFHLRDNVFFHDDKCFKNNKGRKVTAHDFKYCLDKIALNNPAENQGFWVFKDIVKGANEYYEKTATNKQDTSGISGITIVNDTTLQIELTEPYAVFLARLGLTFAKIYPREAFEMYGSEMRNHCVGTGPFFIKKVLENQVVFLTKNQNYWGKDEFGNPLPYLDNIKVTFIHEKKMELQEFIAGKSDLVYKFPLEMVDEIIDIDKNLKPEYRQFQLQYMPSMSLQYYGFLHTGKIFNNKLVRQALCYALDREKLCKYTLKNSGFPAKYGIVPPGTGTYNSELIKGFTYEPEKARQLLADAGFPNGKNFPKITLQLNSGGSRNTQVAEAIKKMIEETLNIKIDLLVIPWAQHTEAIETAKSDFFRLGWIADYPDAENFLNLFHSKHVPENPTEKTYINSYRYKSKTFDILFDEALRTIDDEKRNLLYAKADQQVIDDAVVLPTYYDIDFRLLQPNIRNYPQNSMEYRDFSKVYFIPPTKTEK